MSKKLTDEEALKRNLVIDSCIKGLTTDGAHHKQGYLEDILKLFTNEVEFRDIKEREQWISGS